MGHNIREVMQRRRFAILGALVVSFAAFGLAQDRAVNPLRHDANAVRTGTSLFQAGCSDCHGIDAKGVLAPDLTALWTAGASDERLFQTIRQGVSGTPMPSSRLADEEI